MGEYILRIDFFIGLRNVQCAMMIFKVSIKKRLYSLSLIEKKIQYATLSFVSNAFLKLYFIEKSKFFCDKKVNVIISI